jgi:3'-phosphoadenosine 5'-phosphosulfate sulfotransferase (PAPS reductase)/FAD synthetase
MNKPRLKISFSGGRTSGFMTKYILDNYSDKYEIVVTFANTGQEHESTLKFVHDCDNHFGFNTVWLEAEVYHNERKGSGHKIVTYETASRNGAPYEEVIKKYGIPNMIFQPCNRELKLNPMNSYLDSIGWESGSYFTAIGIRADETRRVSVKAGVQKIVYPLIDWLPTDKQDVNDWWDDQDFNLELLEHQGNCTWCWKKSLNKHIRLIKENPEFYDFPRRMEATYGFHGSPCYGVPKEGVSARVFFRNYRSTNDLFALAAESEINPNGLPTNRDVDGGCSESCEVYTTE